MLSFFAKFLLAATALSPMLGAIAINLIAQKNPYYRWLPWLVAGVLLLIICWRLLIYAENNGEKHIFHITEFEDNNKEILAFLLAYLLPFLANDKLEFKGEWMTGVYIMVIIILTIVHTGAYNFNPVMGMIYHFYSAKNKDGVSNLLICRKPLKKTGVDIEMVSLSHNIYLGRRTTDAE